MTLASAVLAVVLVPLSTSSGEQLEGQVGRSALVERHAELADGLLPWVIGLLIVAVLLAVRDRLNSSGRWHRVPPGGLDKTAAGLTRPAVLGILAVLVVVGTTQQVVRIGHSDAAWNGVASASNR